MEYKTGFNCEQFERDHFHFHRGSREKFFNGWSDVRYHFGLTPFSCNEQELRHGRMGKALYDNLCHVYGEDTMSQYFPTEKVQRRPTLLHDSIGAVQHNYGNNRPSHNIPDGAMSEAEIDALAAIM